MPLYTSGSSRGCRVAPVNDSPVNTQIGQSRIFVSLYNGPDLYIMIYAMLTTKIK